MLQLVTDIVLVVVRKLSTVEGVTSIGKCWLCWLTIGDMLWLTVDILGLAVDRVCCSDTHMGTVRGTVEGTVTLTGVAARAGVGATVEVDATVQVVVAGSAMAA